MVRAIVGLVLFASVASMLGLTVLLMYNEVRLRRASDDATRQRYLQFREKYYRFQQFVVSLCIFSGLVSLFLR